jgi:hypothetical protein
MDYKELTYTFQGISPCVFKCQKKFKDEVDLLVHKSISNISHKSGLTFKITNL